jgi:hypothetical protein
MIEFYIDIDEYAPNRFKTEMFKDSVIKNSQPIIDYIFEKLNEFNYNLDEFYKKLSDIVDDLPIMSIKLVNGEIILKYNRWVDIKFVNSTKSIYRDIKLNKLIG